MKEAHIVLGSLAIAANAIAVLLGARAWRRALQSAWFWRVLRAGQALVIVEAALGGILLAIGKKPGHLHVLYGLLPLLIAFLAEQFRAASAQMVLDQYGHEDARAVAELPAAEQQGLVSAIIQRELAVMTLAALVIVVLLLRAAQTS